MDRSIRRIPAILMLLASTSLGHAENTLMSGGERNYAISRIETAFRVVAEMPPAPPVGIPVAVKGDLVLGCAGPFLPDVQAECIDTAYEVDSDPPVIVETRRGSTSYLTRLVDYAIAANLAESAVNKRSSAR